MTVRSRWRLIFALAVLPWFSGCGRNDPNVVTAETDDPTYIHGKELLKQGRTPEALASFLKVIERRGEQSSAESHLDAGIIYLKDSKDPVEAYHHFRQYLALQPNSKQAPYVRELIDNARREFARTLPAQSLDNQSQHFELADQIDKLQRENDELHAQLTALRGGANAGVPRTTHATLGVEANPVRPIIPAEATPVGIAPDSESPISLAPLPPNAAPAAAVASSNPSGAPRTAAANVRPTPTRPPAAASATGPIRRHRVAQGEGLFAIAKKYYGVASNEKVKAIYEANRDIMKNDKDLKVGMELKIP